MLVSNWKFKHIIISKFVEQIKSVDLIKRNNKMWSQFPSIKLWQIWNSIFLNITTAFIKKKKVLIRYFNPIIISYASTHRHYFTAIVAFVFPHCWMINISSFGEWVRRTFIKYISVVDPLNFLNLTVRIILRASFTWFSSLDK